MFWIREIAGWALVLIAIYLIRIGLLFLTNTATPGIVEAAVVMMAGLGILRVGVLLIRISTAARLFQQDKKS